MEFKLNIPVKKKDVIYTVDNCKIEKYYVTNVRFTEQIGSVDNNVSNIIELDLDRYNDGASSYTTSRRLAYCFLSKDELIEQLDN